MHAQSDASRRGENMLNYLAINVKACTVVERGDGCTRCAPGSELQKGGELKKAEQLKWMGSKYKHMHEIISIVSGRQ